MSWLLPTQSSSLPPTLEVGWRGAQEMLPFSHPSSSSSLVPCRMNDEIRKLFSNLGSTHAKQLGFRDSWVFLGAQNLKSKSPFEQVSSWQPPCPSEGGMHVAIVRATMPGTDRQGLGWLGKNTRVSVRRATQLSSTLEVRVARLAPSQVGSSIGHCARRWVLYKHIDK